MDAGASVVARRGAARHVWRLTVLPGVLRRAPAMIRAHFVDADAGVEARGGGLRALVDVLLAGLAVESRRAGADVGGVKGRALAAIGARIGSTRVGNLARFTWKIKPSNELFVLFYTGKEVGGGCISCPQKKANGIPDHPGGQRQR